jgi:hypothetical protein
VTSKESKTLIMPNTPPGKLSWYYKVLLIALPIIGVSYLAVENNWFKGNRSGDTLIIPNTDSAGNKGNNTGVSKDSSLFSYLPEKPVDGKLKGVVEVGASGFNSFVVSIDQQKRWEVMAQDFGQSLVYEGLATTADISNGLNKYIAMMADKGVDRKNMYFLISSGAQKDPKTKPIAAELKKMGFDVILVSAQQEGEWALTCILPQSYHATAFVTDIGSGNTKLAWLNGEKIEVLEAPGSKYYEKEIKNEVVYENIKEKALKIPSEKRQVCFIMGGTPYDLAKQHRNGEERYTLLKNPDDYTANKPKTKAGLNIYKAIKEATGCKTFVFDWYGNFTIGYLLDLTD